MLLQSIHGHLLLFTPRVSARGAVNHSHTYPTLRLTLTDKLQLDPAVPALHYGVQCFEGMKVQRALPLAFLFLPDLAA